MPYLAMPSRFMPIDADGTVVGQSLSPTTPVSSYPTSGEVIAWVATTGSPAPGGISGSGTTTTFCFFPEQRMILGAIWGGFGGIVADQIATLEGSNDTANGSDGTFEAASAPSGYPIALGITTTSWRDSVKPFTFTGAKATVRFYKTGVGTSLGAIHLYGVKATGQTPDDILFLDGDITFAEYTVDKDFGDRPLGTTVVKQFKLKNSSGTKTANTIVVTCNDADFAISNDGVTYGTTFTVTSLGAGVSSAVFYIRNTTPAPGAALGPRQVRLSAAVGSYT